MLLRPSHDLHACSVEREWFGEIADVEGVHLAFLGVFDLEEEPLLVPLSVSIHIQVQIVLGWSYIFSSF